MKKIAITGVGGGVGQSIIKALQDSDFNLIGMDGEVLATGLYAVPRSYLIPYAKNQNFIESLLDICKSEKIDILFPGLDAELIPLSENREKFSLIGTKVIVSTPDVIKIADNKMLTYNFLKENEIPVPFTIPLDEFISDVSLLEVPYIIKPKEGGARSKNVFKIKKPEELDLVVKLFDIKPIEYIAQEYIEGDEYTCGSVTLNDKFAGTIIMKRILRDGDTYKCFVEENSVIESVIKKIAEKLKPFGALNVQLRVRDNVPYVFELNARCSGTTAARAICGFNEPKMIADYILNSIEPVFFIEKLSIVRYLKELVIEDKQIKELGEKNSLKSSSPSATL